MSGDRDELLTMLETAFREQSLHAAVLSGPDKSATDGVTRIDVRPVLVRNDCQWQFTSRTVTQQFHANYPTDAAITELGRLIGSQFRNFRATTATHDYEARFSKRGKCFVKVRQRTVGDGSTAAGSARRERGCSASASGSSVLAHNQARNYLIADGVPCPFLIQTGIMRPDGRVRADQMKKFRQINRYLEFIRDVLPALPEDRPVRVVDFGCGKSYLTFAVHHYLTDVLQRDCLITGLDRRTDVVATCTGIVESLGLGNLHFQVGSIDGFATSEPVDLVISLHACDTATDDALAQAVAWKCPVVLAVPCCQHELLPLLETTSCAPLTTYGITRERLAALATDSIRTALMTAAGYQSNVMEFIETEHTPKNLLIRCVQTPGQNVSASQRAKALADVQSLAAQLGLPPLALERRLSVLGVLPHSVSDEGPHVADDRLPELSLERNPATCPAP